MRYHDSLARHDFVWLTPDVREHQVTAFVDQSLPILAEWIASGYPLIVARSQPTTPSGWYCVGLPLPPEQGKRRLGFSVSDVVLAQVKKAPTLDDVLSSAPAAWQLAISNLIMETSAAGLVMRVYGSFAWQALTGLSYVSNTSDIDLIWSPRDQRELALGIEVLQFWETKFSLVADGEILLPDGRAVAWREFSAQPDRVLVKGLSKPALEPFWQIKALFPESCGACG